MVDPQDVLSFWLDEVGPSGWYATDAALDAKIAARFGPTIEAARSGSLGLWLTYPSGALAYLILTDQFTRNIYRGTAEAFTLDPLALAVAKQAICKGWDKKIDAPARQFFYLPLMHSENLSDQDRCVRLMCERMPESDDNMLHARAHREVIRQFGRFPYRNEALSRTQTQGEQAYAAAGGYGHTLRTLQQAQAA
ncbi:DUF924 domain-containing protein [Sulfitobacter albidus]|uniref:DUF924 domain-containing protein n=1 Tax=Sulfitobacter albidus TaxID=2829501 RepID=A0A975JF91_9RHOB|nr:DUF924 family protein [Sulfitobacter albidus]QUJ77429.1 DUF924 domain-containing protein [Sulfitobacter albidus]